MLDIDNFKQINDTFGHATGDELLGTVAQKLQATFREQDLIGRMGGDEFAVFLVDINERDTVVSRARRLGEELDIQVEEGGYTAHISCSIGMCIRDRPCWVPGVRCAVWCWAFILPTRALACLKMQPVAGCRCHNG